MDVSHAASPREGIWRFRFPNRLASYIFALVAVVATAGASQLLAEALRWEPTVLYVGAVALVAFLAGLGPALLATFLSVAAVEFLFLPPEMGVGIHEARDLVILGIFGGVALAISWLTEQLDRHQREVQEAARRNALLSEATRLVGEAESYVEALRELPELLCRSEAEYAITYACDPEGGRSIRRVGVAHADPDREPLVRRLLAHRRPTTTDQYGAGAVIRSGAPVLVEEIPDHLLERAAEGDTEYLELLRRLDPISSILVPLRARGHTIGAIALATTGRSGRRYDEDDLDLILELGYRVALVLDNLRLLEEARAATETRERIMAIVAHDFRNPLSTMVSAAQLLDREGASKQTREVAASLERAAEQGLELVEDLVNLSRMEAGEYDVDPRPVPVGELLTDAREAGDGAAAGTGVELTVEPPPAGAAVPADRKRLRRVFSNLLENACRFSPEGGTVRITARPEGEEVVFSVTDDGPGIPEENMPHLFEQFWQGEADGGGAGLGLAIVRGIVEAHGGRAWAENVDGGGASVCFTLPRSSSEGVAEPPTRPSIRRSGSPRGGERKRPR